ncbi:MAG: hypothetical protein GY940_43690, partial [bacterium]|nr:hypothetical protein [bacterium]
KKIGGRAISIDDRYVYLLGGYPTDSEYLRKVFLFDNEKETIEELTSFMMPLTIRNFAAVWVPNGRLFIAGGDDYFYGGWSDKTFYSESLTYFPTMTPSQPSSSPSDSPYSPPSPAPTPSPVYYIQGNVSSIIPNTQYIYGSGYRQYAEQLIECNVNYTQSCLVECKGKMACLGSTINCGPYYCGIQCIGDDGGTLMPCSHLNIIAKNTKIVEILCKGKDSCDQMTISASYGDSFSITMEGDSSFSSSQISLTNVANAHLFCSGKKACEDADVTVTGASGSIIVHSTGEGAFEDSSLVITNSDEVLVICNATEACENLQVHMDETVSRGTVSCEVPNSCRYLNTFCPFERSFDGHTEVINIRCHLTMHANDRANYIYSPLGIDYVQLDCVEEDT